MLSQNIKNRRGKNQFFQYFRGKIKILEFAQYQIPYAADPLLGFVGYKMVIKWLQNGYKNIRENGSFSWHHPRKHGNSKDESVPHLSLLTSVVLLMASGLRALKQQWDVDC